MIDDDFGIGAGWGDWITPVWGAVAGLLYGPSRRLWVSGGYTGREISLMMSHNHIQAWAFQSTQHAVTFKVVESQADRAEAILKRHGLTLS